MCFYLFYIEKFDSWFWWTKTMTKDLPEWSKRKFEALTERVQRPVFPWCQRDVNLNVVCVIVVGHVFTAKGWMATLNERGTRLDPCGIPQATTIRSDQQFQILTKYFLSSRYWTFKTTTVISKSCLLFFIWPKTGTSPRPGGWGRL